MEVTAGPELLIRADSLSLQDALSNPASMTRARIPLDVPVCVRCLVERLDLLLGTTCERITWGRSVRRSVADMPAATPVASRRATSIGPCGSRPLGRGRMPAVCHPECSLSSADCRDVA